MLTCDVCGSPDVFAIRPGSEPEGLPVPDLFTPRAANADRGERMQCWCEKCWPYLRRAA